MKVIGADLLMKRQGSGGLKFILNDIGIAFFPMGQQHRDMKVSGLSYEDDYRGNAVAGLIGAERVDIRFHSAFTDERIRGLWSRVKALPEVAAAGLGQLYYQGRRIG